MNRRNAPSLIDYFQYPDWSPYTSAATAPATGKAASAAASLTTHEHVMGQKLIASCDTTIITNARVGSLAHQGQCFTPAIWMLQL